MTTVLRVILIVMSILVLVVVIRRVRHARAAIKDSAFWIFFAVVLVVFSIFPGVAEFLSGLVGTMSTANFIFMLMIFLLLVKCFSMSMRISQLEAKIKKLTQAIAINDNKIERSAEEKDKNSENE